MSDLQLLVIGGSPDGLDLWAGIAHDVDLSVRHSDTEQPPVPGRGTVAMVLDSRDDEHEAFAWLGRHELPPSVPVFVTGKDPGHRIAARAVSSGAADYFVLPEDAETIRNALIVASRKARAAIRQADEPPPPLDGAFHELVGESHAIRDVLARAGRILPHRDATALIQGETGTGKELLARAIHDGSPRRHAPFIAVNCSGVPATLFESELFGHQRGAFTDAHHEKPGLFEAADGGTLFFDEVGLLPFDVQGKLLRVLEDRRVRRLGSTKERVVDVRILAATNEDLERGIEKGTFRKDFFYRIGVIALHLPPLRERGEDSLLIARVLLERLGIQHGLPVPAINAAVRRRLLAHHWPGNVRELRNALERSLLLSPRGELAPGELAVEGRPVSRGPRGLAPFPGTLRSVTTWAVREMLAQCDGNRSEAARRLDISRGRLRRILDEDADGGNKGG